MVQIISHATSCFHAALPAISLGKDTLLHALYGVDTVLLVVALISPGD